ncbi:glycosyltransferase family 4 protein [Clostridium sp. LP20]|uniref:glycosyltransferase family 4 protein n=1 Tax=Clostridium sp. LP20 TaxID=3418665 RepID=UPI003EE7731F
MKICFLTDTIFLHGGVARVITTLANNLGKDNEVDIICTQVNVKKDYKLYDLDEKNVNVIYKPLKGTIFEKIRKRIFKKINNISSYFDNEKMSKLQENVMYPKRMKSDLISFFNNKEYDIIIGCHFEYTIILGLIAPYLNAKTISWQHNMYEAYISVKGRYIYNKINLFKRALYNIDANVVLTKKDQENYEKFLNKKSFQIYNPTSIVSKTKSLCDSNTIISVGRLDKSKGFDMLIKAFKDVNKCNDKIKLNIVGDGEQRSELSQLIKELNLTEVVNLNGFSNNIQDLYTQSDIYVCSSRWEGFPLTPIEAMECGLPIISFDIPSAKELIEDNKYGILVKQGDIKRLTNEMIKMVEDKNYMNNYSKKSIERAREFSIEKIMEDWHRLFVELKLE